MMRKQHRNSPRPSREAKGRERNSTESVSQAELNRAYRGFTIMLIACAAYVLLREMGWI